MKTFHLSLNETSESLIKAGITPLPLPFRADIRSLLVGVRGTGFERVMCSCEHFAKDFSQWAEDTYPTVSEIRVVIDLPYSIGGFLEQALASYGIGVDALFYDSEGKPVLVEIM